MVGAAAAAAAGGGAEDDTTRGVVVAGYTPMVVNDATVNFAASKQSDE